MKFFQFVLLILVIHSCRKVENTNSSDQLQQIIASYEQYEGYDENRYPLGLFTEAHFKKEAEFAVTKLEDLSKLDFNGLGETEKISAELLKFILQDAIDNYRLERYLNPLLSDAGFHSDLPYMVRPLTDYKQTRKYMAKLQALPGFVDQHFDNLREGLARGFSQPKVIFKGYESTYDDHIVSNYKDSYFYSPFLRLPETLTSSQKDSVLKAAQSAIENTVIPQFERIKLFFEEEYMPNTRTSIGISEIPNGRDYYQNRINFYTTGSSYTADSIHNIGLKEVARIKQQMEKNIEKLHFKGSFSDFLVFLRTDARFYAKSPREFLMIARDMAKRADEQLPRFFNTLPRKPYGVAPVPASIAPKFTGGRYVGTDAESTDPGYYWVNTYDLPSRPLYTLPSLTVHEAVPGHHLQGALNLELGDSIPKFRKDLYLSAYGKAGACIPNFWQKRWGCTLLPMNILESLPMRCGGRAGWW
jgi:uncharacterized protein (DUF885 family)